MKKQLFLASSIIMVICITLSPITTYAEQDYYADEDVCAADMIDSRGDEYLFDPETNEYLPIRHIESEAEAVTERNGRDYEFEHLFESKRAQDALLAKAPSLAHSAIYSPVPGGVGYGAYFTSSFQHGFTTGTTLFYNIICPSKAGGDVNNYLYLTSTNRAAKGVEAFISYYKQNNPYFKIYDWARPESARWQVSMSYSDLSDYLTLKTIKGVYRQCITVQNRTVKSSSTQWKNVVWLKNYRTNSYDQIYTYTYTATLSDQRDSYYGSWGPIVETFQSSYGEHTNIIGFYNINLQSKTTAYTNTTWGAWELLTPSVSTIRNDKLGFHVVFETPNYTFGVH